MNTTPLSIGYQLIIAILTKAGLPIVSTATYPRIVLDGLQGEELDKGGNIYQISGTLHAISEDSYGEAFALMDLAKSALTTATDNAEGWKFLNVSMGAISAVTETSETANIINRLTVSITAIIEQ